MKKFFKIILLLVLIYFAVVFTLKITGICPDAYGAGFGYGGRDILFKLKLCPFSELIMG